MNMTDERRKKLCVRWSLVTAILITIFWTVYYFIVGSVPTETKAWVVIGNISLPFGISRWWDILSGPAWLTILILDHTKKRAVPLEIKIIPMGIALGTAIIPIVISGLTYGLIVFGIVYGLILSIVYLLSLPVWQPAINWLLAK